MNAGFLQLVLSCCCVEKTQPFITSPLLLTNAHDPIPQKLNMDCWSLSDYYSTLRHQ